MLLNLLQEIVKSQVLTVVMLPHPTRSINMLTEKLNSEV
jgi:hypothetical protein